MIRGNHENCERGGHGFFLFLDPRPLPEAYATDYCLDYSDPYALQFKKEQLLVMDDSKISPLKGGIDHYDFHLCPSGTNTALPTSRYDDPDQTRDAINNDLDTYKQQMVQLGTIASSTHLPSIYVSHRPLFGFACNGSHYQTLDWTMQQAYSNSADQLTSVVLAIGGHMHWFEGVDFADRAHPAQIVVGNAGTKLIPNTVPPDVLQDAVLDVLGAKVSIGATKDAFGYAVMRSANASFDINAIAFVKVTSASTPAKTSFWNLTVSREPRQ